MFNSKFLDLKDSNNISEKIGVAKKYFVHLNVQNIRHIIHNSNEKYLSYQKISNTKLEDHLEFNDFVS